MFEWTLFFSALISSTLLPGGSEALLIWNVLNNPDRWLIFLTVASLGNILGSFVTYAMGWLIAVRFPFKKVTKSSHLKAQYWVKRYGAWTMLLAWLPFIGDPLCLVAGWLRLSPWLSLGLIALGKIARYGVVTYVTLMGGRL